MILAAGAGPALVEKMKREATEAGQPDPLRDIPEKIHGGMPWESLALSDQETGDGQIADMALAALDRVQRKRFFLAAGFLRPHLPFVAPKKYWDIYHPEKLPTPETAFPPNGSPPLIGNRSRELLRQYRGLPTKLPLDRETERQLVHGYYACVSFIDAQIGRLLEGLASRGLADNTVVVITSDHGFQLGDHRMWGKATNFELSARVPLLVRVPGGSRAGPGRVPGGSRAVTRRESERLRSSSSWECIRRSANSPGCQNQSIFRAAVSPPSSTIQTSRCGRRLSASILGKGQPGTASAPNAFATPSGGT